MILIANTDRSGSLETPDSETQHKGIRSATRVPRLVGQTREALHPAQCPHTAAHQVEILDKSGWATTVLKTIRFDDF